MLVTAGSTASALSAAPDPILFSVPDISEADIAAVVAVLRSRWITTGSECTELERELEEHLGCRYAVAVSSCTAAMEIALAHLRLPPGSRVGVPAWTFVSTALAAVHNQLQPVLLDVEPDTLNLSPASLQAALDEGLDAVIAVHFGGVPVSRAIHDLCAAAAVPLIEDAAHALGASDHRGLIGGGSGTACFSFYATKNLTSAEGGAIATNSADLAEFARSYRLHGMSADSWARYRPGGAATYDVVEPGLKANLPDVLAALARSQLRRFSEMQVRRREILDRYRRHFDVLGLAMVPAAAAPGSADHLAVMLLPKGVDRNLVMDGLKRAGINPSVHFRPLHTFTWMRENAIIGPSGLATCDALAARELSLPLHVGLQDNDIDRIGDTLASLLRA